MSKTEDKTATRATVVGADGRRLRLSDLPGDHMERWVVRRKTDVVLAVRGGLIERQEAYRRYHLTPEEFASWESLVDRYGPAGLRTTRLKRYRQRSNLQPGRRPGAKNSD